MPYCSQCNAPYSQGERFCPADGAAVLLEGADDGDDPLIGRTVGGRYFVKRLIARGGMGAVYEAEHVGLDKRVALKFILDRLAEDREAVMRFHREARTASRIGHDNIVDITDVGETEDGRPFLAMEYLDGSDLFDVLRAETSLSPTRAVAIVRQVLAGLGAAHAAGVVHRDMKPENVFLARRTGQSGETVKIMDFGISKLVAARDARLRLTETGVVIGTPIYMSPEQASGTGDVDARADLYAVGALLFEMLTGRPPFVAGSYVALVTQHLHDTAPRLRSIKPELAQALDDCIARALEKEPDARFDSADEFARALPDASALYASAPPASAPRGRRWAPLILIAVAAVLAAGGIAGALAIRSGDAVAEAKPPARPPRANKKRPRPRKTDPVAAATSPLLSIDSSPRGARVTVDGRDVGVTPVEVPVDAGAHQVRIELPGREPVEVTRQVRAGSIESLFAALAPAPADSAPVDDDDDGDVAKRHARRKQSPPRSSAELRAPYEDELDADDGAKPARTGSKPNPYLHP